jgi:hypothetical protein
VSGGFGRLGEFVLRVYAARRAAVLASCRLTAQFAVGRRPPTGCAGAGVELGIGDRIFDYVGSTPRCTDSMKWFGQKDGPHRPLSSAQSARWVNQPPFVLRHSEWNLTSNKIQDYSVAGVDRTVIEPVSTDLEGPTSAGVGVFPHPASGPGAGRRVQFAAQWFGARRTYAICAPDCLHSVACSLSGFASTAPAVSSVAETE